jgi:hypothetical protein
MADAFDAEERGNRRVCGEVKRAPVLRFDSLLWLSAAGVVAFEGRQQVAQVGFRTQFFDKADVGPNPVVLANQRLMRHRETFIDGDGIERVATMLATSPGVQSS